MEAFRHRVVAEGTGWPSPDGQDFARLPDSSFVGDEDQHVRKLSSSAASPFLQQLEQPAPQVELSGTGGARRRTLVLMVRQPL